MNTVGMIFAAGIGSRLKPFTDRHPKALVEVGGKPMLQRVIGSMAAAGIGRIVVNVHHFASQIADFLDTNANFGLDIVMSDESDRLLETGGGLLKAVPLLEGADGVLIHNADILTDIDLRTLMSAHYGTAADVTMWVKPRPSSRQLYFGEAMELRGWANMATGETRPDGFVADQEMTRRAFSGVQMVSPATLALLAAGHREGEAFPIIPFYLANLGRLTIRGLEADAAWFDVGRPESLEAARRYCIGLG